MAVKYAIVTGNWSDTTTWNGGTLPEVGDDVYANGYTVTIDKDITVSKISTEECPDTLNDGGRFNTDTTRLVTANVVAGASICLYVTGVASVIGDVTGGYGLDAYGVRAQNYGYVNITGDVTGGSGANCHGIYTYYSQAINITGDVTGGSTSSAYGISAHNMHDYELTIIGDVIADVAPAVYINGMEMTIIGHLVASDYAMAIQPTTFSSRALTIVGTLTNSTNWIAVSGYTNIKLSPSDSLAWLFFTTDNNEKPLYTADFINMPDPSDVRDTVSYGLGSANVGTCKIPPPSSVVKNVPVDDTVGTWAFSSTLIERLEQCATVSSTGAQIAAFES